MDNNEIYCAYRENKYTNYGEYKIILFGMQMFL